LGYIVEDAIANLVEPGLATVVSGAVSGRRD
jgi:hypothetical protein